MSNRQISTFCKSRHISFANNLMLVKLTQLFVKCKMCLYTFLACCYEKEFLHSFPHTVRAFSPECTHSCKIYGKSLDLRQTALRRTFMLVRDSKEKTQNIRRERCNHNYNENFGKQNVYKLELKLKIIQTILLAILLKWQNKKIIINIIEKNRLEICA